MSANSDLIARERKLPGLALMLDPKGLAEVLGCGPLQLDYLRLKSDTSCVASYRLGDNWLFAKAVTADRMGELRSGPDLGELPHRVLPELALEIVPAAADRRMRGLADAMDPKRRRDFLAQLRRAGIDADALKVFKLKPQRRLVGRLDRAGAPVGFLKIYASERFAEALVAATLTQLGPAPRLLYANAKSGAIVTEWLDGETLDAATSDLTEFRMAGELLAKVHATELPIPTRSTRKDDLSAIDMIVADCAVLLPALSGRLSAVGQRLKAALLGQPVTIGFIHGDFSADQVLIGPEGPHLIDWDRSAIGDRGNDIGCFLARQDKDVLDGAISRERADAACDALLAGYGPLPPSVPVQHLRNLALLLTEDFRRQSPDWDQRIDALLSLIEGELDRLPAPGIEPDEALPALADALHDPAMAPLLAQAGYTLTARPQLVRHKSGRRAMIRYEATPQPLLGKMRRKGLDRRTVRLHGDLRAAGLDGAGGVSVPEVVLANDELSLWIMPLLDGVVLDPQDHGDDTFHNAGAALARLHSAPIETDREWTLEDEAEVLDRALAQLAGDRPEVASALDSLTRKARHMIEAIPPDDQVLLHRDFYPDQLLVQRGGVVLLDLDLAARGPSAVDLGNFLAHLRELGLRRHGDLAAYDAAGDAFLRGYGSVRPLPDARAIERLREISLWRHLAISQRFDDRRGYFDDLLTHAQSYSG